MCSTPNWKCDPFDNFFQDRDPYKWRTIKYQALTLFCCNNVVRRSRSQRHFSQYPVWSACSFAEKRWICCSVSIRHFFAMPKVRRVSFLSFQPLCPFISKEWRATIRNGSMQKIFRAIVRSTTTKKNKTTRSKFAFEMRKNIAIFSRDSSEIFLSFEYD